MILGKKVLITSKIVVELFGNLEYFSYIVNTVKDL